MQPRTELALGTALVLVLAVVAGLVGLGRERLTDADRRRSTFLMGPVGARGTPERSALGVRWSGSAARRARSIRSPVREPSSPSSGRAVICRLAKGWR
jgi:hypothetical protein